MVDPEGNPYGLPISYVLEGETIYLHGAQEGKKITLLNHKSEVCLTVVGPNELDSKNFTTKYASAIVYGKAAFIEERSAKIEALRLIVEKYSPAFKDEAEIAIEEAVDKTALIKIEIDEVTGKSNRHLKR